MCIRDRDTALIKDCEFEGNRARSDYLVPFMDEAYGGALYLGGDASVSGCSFLNNYCDAGVMSSGGAIWNSAVSTVERSSFVGNRAESSAQAVGGALGGQGTALHCNLVENTSTGTAACAESWTLRNSILVPAPGSIDLLGSAASVEYSLSPMALVGPGNVMGDPGFRAPDDFHLLPGSAAIDAGDPLSPIDPDGSRADIGLIPFGRFNCGPGCFIAMGPLSCPATVNSTGLPGRTLLLSSTDVTTGELVLVADQVPKHVLGSFLFSVTSTYLPFFAGGAGNLCLGGAVLHLGTSHSNQAGRAHLVIQADALPQVFSLEGGGEWNFQYWHRDRQSGQANSNFAAGLKIHL